MAGDVALFCEHDALAASCEQCAFTAGLERGVIAPGTVLYPPLAAQRRRADTDLDVPVGEGRTVHVRAGDLIPLDLLEHLDAAPVKGKPPPTVG